MPFRRAFPVRRESWRSGLEEAIGKQLADAGVGYEYESLAIPFVQPSKPRKYTPDYILLSNGIIVESKGLFESKDRQKHLMVKQQHPDLEIRFVFSNPNNRISKQSQTTYAKWAEDNGFKFAAKLIPPQWFTEAPILKSLAAIAALKKSRG